MYFSYGWPRTFGTGFGATPAVGQDVAAQEDEEEIVMLHLDSEYCVVISKRAIQVWTGGKNRVKLGQVARDAESMEQLGCNVAGVWSTSRHQLAVLVRNHAQPSEASAHCIGAQTGPVHRKTENSVLP